MKGADGDSSVQYWLPLLVWLGAVLAASSIPGSTLANVGLRIQDKVAHASEYSVLGFLTYRWCMGTRRWWLRGLVVAIAVGAAFGGLDESYQRWIPEREPSVADWWADVVGVTLGGTVGLVYYWALRAFGRAGAATTAAQSSSPDAGAGEDAPSLRKDAPS